MKGSTSSCKYKNPSVEKKMMKTKKIGYIYHFASGNWIIKTTKNATGSKLHYLCKWKWTCSESRDWDSPLTQDLKNTWVTVMLYCQTRNIRVRSYECDYQNESIWKFFVSIMKSAVWNRNMLQWWQ